MAERNQLWPGEKQVAPFSTSTIMPARKSSGRRPGRPRSGKIGYTVRMPPETHKAWCRAARDEGFEHLGDFLASLPGLSLEPDTRLGPARRLTIPLARRRFGVIADTVRALTDELYDLLDFDIHMTGDALVCQRFSALNATHQQLERTFRKYSSV
jgi:hypothetical protein